MPRPATLRLPVAVGEWINQLERCMTQHTAPPTSRPKLPRPLESYRPDDAAAYKKALRDYDEYSKTWMAEYRRVKALFFHFYAESTPDDDKLETIYELIQLDHTVGVLNHIREHAPFYLPVDMLRGRMTSKLAELGRRTQAGDAQAKKVFRDFTLAHPEALYS